MRTCFESSSSCSTCAWPLCAACISGVAPHLSLAATFAPKSNSSDTTTMSERAVVGTRQIREHSTGQQAPGLVKGKQVMKGRHAMTHAMPHWLLSIGHCAL